MGPLIKHLRLGALICIAAAVCTPTLAQDKKVTLQELITNHLDSLGSAQARSSAKNRVVSGTVKLVSRVGIVSNIDGQAALASSGAKLRYSIRFNSPQYTGEQLAFDGTKVLTGFLPSGRRSPLSLYLDQQSLPLREGLLGGTISTGWILLRLDQLKPRLDYKGVKKVDGRTLHEVSYRPEKGSTDLKVALFFDATSFRHVRTEYEFRVPARLGSGPNDSARLQEDFYKLAEDFEDFRAVDGLTIPYKYRLQLQVQTSTGSNLFDWTVAIEQVMHNQALDDQIFSK
jgi:hypothetical protein